MKKKRYLKIQDTTKTIGRNTLNLYFSLMTSNKNLNTIAENYNTDKFDHGYTKIYEKYFESLRDQKLKILEIGIADGKSLLMWSDYFKNSLVIGIDIHQINIEEKKLNRANINVHQGSQSDKKFIEEIIKEYKQFDIIIDDGSHLAKDVKKSFELYFQLLKMMVYMLLKMFKLVTIIFLEGTPLI